MIFDSFGPAARKVVMEAQQQARGLGHDYVGTEHLLFAVLAAEQEAGGGILTGHGITLEAARTAAAAKSASWVPDADALRAAGVDPATVTEQARRQLGSDLTVAGHTAPPRPAGVPADAVAFTPRVRRVFEMAVASKAAAEQPAGAASEVGANDLLAAILDEGAGLAPLVLEQLGVDLVAFRTALATTS